MGLITRYYVLVHFLRKLTPISLFPYFSRQRIILRDYLTEFIGNFTVFVLNEEE
jgi:hypothetical protein